MNVDLHVHTIERSPCAIVSEIYQIETAIKAGLDGIAITDHYTLVPRQRLLALNEIYAPFKIFTGIELSAGPNDWLVLGVDDPAIERKDWRYPDLLDFVRARDGYIILAHPFRRSPDLGDDLETYRPDGIEEASINTPAHRREDIRAIAARLGLALFTNSDAHYPDAVGSFRNRLPRMAADDKALVEVLREMKMETAACPNVSGR